MAYCWLPHGTGERCFVSTLISTQEITSPENKEIFFFPAHSEPCFAQGAKLHCVNSFMWAWLKQSSNPSCVVAADSGTEKTCKWTPQYFEIKQNMHCLYTDLPAFAILLNCSEGLMVYKNEHSKASSGRKCGCNNQIGIRMATISIIFRKYMQSNEILSPKWTAHNFCFLICFSVCMHMLKSVFCLD